MNIDDLIPLSEEYANPLSETQLLDLERQLGYTLPIEYRDFLLQHNGGQACGVALFDCHPGGELEGNRDASEIPLAAFYCVDQYGGSPNANADYNSISEQMYRFGVEYPDIVPNGWMVVAGGEFGELVLLGVEKSNFGKIGYLNVGVDFGALPPPIGPVRIISENLVLS